MRTPDLIQACSPTLAIPGAWEVLMCPVRIRNYPSPEVQPRPRKLYIRHENSSSALPINSCCFSRYLRRVTCTMRNIA